MSEAVRSPLVLDTYRRGNNKKAREKILLLKKLHFLETFVFKYYSLMGAQLYSSNEKEIIKHIRKTGPQTYSFSPSLGLLFPYRKLL